MVGSRIVAFTAKVLATVEKARRCVQTNVHTAPELMTRNEIHCPKFDLRPQLAVATGTTLP